MKKAFLATCILLLFALQSKAQTWVWDSVIGVHTGNIKFCKDAANNIYLYNPNAYSIPQPFTRIDKISSSGNPLWNLLLPSNVRIKHIVASTDWHVYLGGTFTGSFTLAGTTIMSTNSSDDIWVAKFTSSGLMVWCKAVSSKGGDELGEICMNGTDLVLTGSTGDTTDFFGSLLPKENQRHLFVAKASSAGFLQAIKFASTAGTPTIFPSSHAAECATDVWGNIFIFASFTGACLLDTFHLGTDAMYQQVSTTRLVKLNSQLQVEYSRYLTSCFMSCPESVYDLNVNNIGEPYFIQSRNYGQSGNDTHYSWVNRMTSAGISTNTFQPRPDLKSGIYDIELDDCGNVYYTGFCRKYINLPVYYPSLMCGQLTPSLNPLWIKVDSSATNYRYGTALAVVSPSNLFIGGIFMDTLKLATTLIDTNNYYGKSVFLGNLESNSQAPCEFPSTVGLLENATQAFSIYPNPCGEFLYLERNTNTNAEVQVFSYQGKLVLAPILEPEREKLDVSNLPDGIYLIKIKENEITRSAKFVVQKN